MFALAAGERGRGISRVTIKCRRDRTTHDDLNVFGQNVGICLHVPVEPVEEVRDNTQGEVIDDEITPGWVKGSASFQFVDDCPHHFPESAVEKFLDFTAAEGRNDRIGLLAVLAHVHQEVAEPVGPLPVGCMSHDVCDDIALEDPGGQGHDIGEVVIKCLARDPCYFGEAANRHLGERRGSELLFEGIAEPLAVNSALVDMNVLGQ